MSFMQIDVVELCLQLKVVIPQRIFTKFRNSQQSQGSSMLPMNLSFKASSLCVFHFLPLIITYSSYSRKCDRGGHGTNDHLGTHGRAASECSECWLERLARAAIT